ncbi:MAG: hypothetical protein ACLVES_04665 [Faecalibacterium prausnitzii]
MDDSKWEYDYSSSNNPAGDTGYPNVGSSGMNTANTASAFSESTQPSGGATPPPAGPQNTAPAAPKKLYEECRQGCKEHRRSGAGRSYGLYGRLCGRTLRRQ